MNWIRFDKRMPPEDTTVMVSNGPAMGHYHYTKESYDKHCGQVEGHCGGAPQAFVPLWSLDGVRVECPVRDLIQWASLLPVKSREIKPRKSLWQRIKSWIA